MKSIKNLLRGITFLCLANFSPVLFAASVTCHGTLVNPTTIDWKGFLPITVGSGTVESGQLPDTENPGNPVCVCGSFPDIYVGLAMGYWEPFAILDVTRTPYCLVSQGGKGGNDTTDEGDVDTTTTDQHSSYYYVHYYNYPIMQLFNLGLLGGACHTDGGFYIPTYFSELDPTWTKGLGGQTAEQLAEIVFPETELLSNPLVALGAQASCALDAAAALNGLPLNGDFWCAGSQGFMYPLTGEVAEDVSPAQATLLIAERGIYKLHRLGLITDTSKDELCYETHDFIMPKNRYRFQMLYPEQKACEPLGRSTALWDNAAIVPGNGDDTVYLVWRKRNCCNY